MMDMDSVAGCRYLVIGDPVAHSRSPEMQNAGFSALGLGRPYGKLRVMTSELAAFAEYAAKHLSGFNITVPHKEHILPYLAGISETARLAGSVNTVCCRDGALYGDSTDGYGLEGALREAFGLTPEGMDLLFLGTGGAARATAFHLAARGVRSIFFVNRTPERAETLRQEVAAAFPALQTATAPLHDEEAVKSLLRRAQVVIQATSLGLKPGDPSPVPPEWLACNPHLCCFDTIYQETPFLQGAAALGVPVSDGRAMLLYQGAKSLEIWTGRIAPLEAMRAALERSLQK